MNIEGMFNHNQVGDSKVSPDVNIIDRIGDILRNQLVEATKGETTRGLGLPIVKSTLSCHIVLVVNELLIELTKLGCLVMGM